MSTLPTVSDATSAAEGGDEPTPLAPPPRNRRAPADGGVLSRRGFLRAAAVTGGGVATMGVLAACAGPTPTAGWAGGAAPVVGAGPTPVAGATASPMDHGSPAPAPGTPAPDATDHDANALAVVERFLAGEGASMDRPGNQPLEPRLEDGVKVFELTIEEMEHRIDARKEPVAALGFNGTWPGPRLTVVEGDRVRVTFRNRMSESTGIHFHGQRLPNAMDGVPHLTQDPIEPGAAFTYEFTARTPGSHMYHSHHNATDQVGRGLLGAFIVEPKDPAQRYERLYGITQDIIWISNDALGGFTINGRGFPATSPIVATLGETIAIRFMNEGNMMHPWHVHGMPMRVVARDGYPLGPAAFTCDTLGVNPGERFDVIIDCDEPGAWAFHCHILQHAEGRDGMFGMVTALVVQDAAAAAIGGATDRPVMAAARATGSTALLCQVPRA